MRTRTRRIVAGALALLLAMAPLGGTQSFAQEANALTWADVDKLVAATSEDAYKALTAGEAAGEQSVVYVPYTSDGRTFFPKDGMAEEITANLRNVLDRAQARIPMSVSTVAPEDNPENRSAKLVMTPTSPISNEQNGLYYLEAKLPEQADTGIYGYVAINPSAPTTAENVKVRIYTGAVTAESTPKYITPAAISVASSSHESLTPVSSDEITYPTAVDALVAAQKSYTGLKDLMLRPYDGKIAPLVTSLSLDGKAYANTTGEGAVTWRFGVYDANGQRKLAFKPDVADLYPIQSGDTVVWTYSSATLPATLPAFTVPAGITDGLIPEVPGAGTGLEDPGTGSEQPPVTSDIVLRKSGNNRQEVAVNVAREFFPNADTMIVVNNLAFADAISATNLSQGKAPILYTAAKQLLKETADYLKEKAPSKVYVLGGVNSVSEGTFNAIAAALPNAVVERIDGADRYIVNQKTIARGTGYGSTLVAVTGQVESDALTATPLAKALNAPIMLVPQTWSQVQKDILKDQGIAAGQLYVVGGTRYVPEAEIDPAKLGLSKAAIRIAGNDRYEVAANVAKQYFANAQTALFASGMVFSDALVASPIAQLQNAPILLVTRNSWTDATKNYVTGTTSLTKGYVIGGPSTISDTLYQTIIKAFPAK